MKKLKYVALRERYVKQVPLLLNSAIFYPYRLLLTDMHQSTETRECAFFWFKLLKLPKDVVSLF